MKRIKVLYEIDKGVIESCAGILIADNLAVTCACDEFTVDYVKPTDRADVYEYVDSSPLTNIVCRDEAILDRLGGMTAVEFIKAMAD